MNQLLTCFPCSQDHTYDKLIYICVLQLCRMVHSSVQLPVHDLRTGFKLSLCVRSIPNMLSWI